MHLERIGEADDPLEHRERIALVEHEEGVTLLFGSTSNAPAALVAVVWVEERSFDFEEGRAVDELLRLGEYG